MKRFYPGQTTCEESSREHHSRMVSRQAAAQGMVLLENNGILPLRENTRIALFGMGARHTVKGGTGSGDVNSRNTVTVYDGLVQAGFSIVNENYLDRYDAEYEKALKQWEEAVYAAAGPEKDPMKFYRAHASLPVAFPETAIRSEDLENADAVVYVIARISGEAADRREEKGDYYLSRIEEEQLKQLAGSGKPLIVLLNVGGIIDLSFLEEIPVSALLLMSQAGSEGGNAAADILSGRVNPSGRLTDTWAFHYDDYPSAHTFGYRNGNLTEEYYTEGIFVGYRYFDSFEVPVRYPFGYGLSYTGFTCETESLSCDGSDLRCHVRVKNTGSVPGRQVIQVYAACPDGELKTERKRLVSFGKTPLLDPGEEMVLELSFSLRQLTSYHEGLAAYILQKGLYEILIGENAASLRKAAVLKLDHDTVTEQLSNICEQLDALKEIAPSGCAAGCENTKETERAEVPVIDITKACEELILKSDRAAWEDGRDRKLWNAAKEAAGRMSAREKACLVVGARSAMSREYIGSAAGSVPGAAGETTSYAEYGIPSMVLADGPAGIRVQKEYETDPESGEIYLVKDPFEMFEARFFGKMTHHEGASVHYQFAAAFPVGTLLAQTFDTELMEKVGETVSAEMEAFGIGIWLAPGMNIHRNPLCGRNFEYYSEDPLLSGEMAAAVTRGVQKTGNKGVSIKHFACNNQEDNRMHVTAVISERALREIYLKGFEIAVKKSNPLTIMTSYNRINSVHSANSRDLCTTAAREEWGFSGFIMTDWTTTNGGGSSAAKCIAAGNDLVMPGRDSDILEILDALEGKKQAKLTPGQLHESTVRLIYAALLVSGEKDTF